MFYRLINIAKLFFLVALMTGCNSATQIRCEDAYGKFVKRGPILTSKDSLSFIEELGRFVQQNNSCLDVYLTLGDMRLSMGQIDSSITDYKNAIRLAPTNVYAKYKLALCYDYKQYHDSAIIQIESAIALKTKNGVIADFSTKKSELVTELSKYDVNAVDLFFQKGISNYSLGNLDMANQCFRFCINNNSYLGESYLYLGSIFIAKNKFKEGCEAFNMSKLYQNTSAEDFIKQYCK